MPDGPTVDRFPPGVAAALAKQRHGQMGEAAAFNFESSATEAMKRPGDFLPPARQQAINKGFFNG
jgi:hypothetical protein